ncbi:MAG: serine hydrolase [Flavobacteriaceae bacterium]|nr:serine hydrolase [Flavobacteriaceae bacterium]
MKNIKIVAITIAIIFSVIYALNLEYFIKGIRVVYLNGQTTVFIDDLKYFDYETIETTNEKSPWNERENIIATFSDEFEEINREFGTVAYIVIHKDTIIAEKYYKGYSSNSSSNSFSMAKTLVSMMMGKALELGHINSLEDKVIDYIPELKGEFASEVRIIDLATMTSGLDWDEGTSDPFSPVAKQYFVSDVEELMLNQPIIEKPGVKNHYSSGNTQLLSILIERASGIKTDKFFEDEIWSKINPDNDAYWQVDSKKKGNVKSFCCFHSNARDFSRLGKLYLNYGNWNGNQVIDSAFVKSSMKPFLDDFDAYGIGLWLKKHKDLNVSLMSGHQGQYVIMIPEKELIITRLGQRDIDLGGPGVSGDVLTYIDEALKLIID